jgi:integrase
VARDRGLRGRLSQPLINGRRGHFYIVWTEGGRSRRISTGTADRATAQAALIQWRAAQARAPALTNINGLIDHYLQERAEAGVKRLSAMAQALDNIRVHFGPLAPDAITPAYVRRYIADRRAEPRRDGRPGAVSDRTISIGLAYLRAALKLAERDQIIASAPHITLPRGAGIKARTRSLTRDEVRALIIATRHADTAPHIRLFVVLALATAQRGIAIRDLLWRDVDFERGVIYFSRSDPRPSANKRRADLPMTDGLRCMLAQAREIARSDYVIEWDGKPVASLKTGMRALWRRAGIAGVRTHDLRRTAATLAVEAGASFAEVAALLRDSEQITQAHYAHSSPQYLTGVMKRIGIDDGEAER